MGPGQLRTPFRGRVIRPHRLMEALAPLISELADLLDALAASSKDSEWTEAAENLWAAIAAITRKSKLYERVAAIDAGKKPPVRAPPPRIELVHHELRALSPPRKGIHFVHTLAARVRRRR